MTSYSIAICPLGRYGGVRSHILNIKKYSKHRIDIFSSPHPKYIDFLSFLNIHNIPFLDPLGIFTSHVALSTYKVIHLHGHPYWKDAYRIREENPSYIYTIHQIYFEEDMGNSTEWKLKKKMNGYMFDVAKKADTVISVAQWMLPYLKDRGIDAVYIPNAIDSDFCRGASPSIFREKYKIYNDIILFAGDIRKYKRPELFIKLASELPEITFVAKGRGMTREIVEKKFGRIPENLFLLGIVPYQDLKDAYAASKGVVLTSKNDTFPTALLEAMICKKPVVAANNAGPKEIIRNETDGCLFEPDNLNSLIDCVLKVWENPQLGLNGYNRVVEHFIWDKIIKSIDKIYDSFL